MLPWTSCVLPLLAARAPATAEYAPRARADSTLPDKPASATFHAVWATAAVDSGPYADGEFFVRAAA